MPADRRNRVIEAWLEEWMRTVRRLGRDHFIRVSREVKEGETDNSPSYNGDRPWIRQHADLGADR